MSFLAANPDLLKLFASEGKEVPRKLENGGYHIEEHGHEEFLDNKGRRHKVDGYAYKDDTIEISYDHGKLHSWNDNPVKVHSSGKLEWVNERDERHRDGDKPAVKGQDGSLFWYNNDKIHRDGDKPAVEFESGTKFWYKKGKLHRENGPAVIMDSGEQYWYLNDEEQPAPKNA